MTRRFAALLLVAWALSACPARAQEKDATIPYDGPEVVCHILHSLDLRPTLTFDEALIDAKDHVIIVFGNPQLLQQTSRDFKDFLNRGGNLLIASHFAWHAPELSIQFEDKAVSVPDNHPHLKALAYREKSQCPKITYFEPDHTYSVRGDKRFVGYMGRDHRDHPLFRFLPGEIATNCPSRLRLLGESTPWDLHVVFPFDDEHPFWGHDVRSIYMAASSQYAPPEGRTLYIAGHGMFINGMMLQPDNDNSVFTRNALLWLREGPDGTKRTKAFFVVDGKIVQNFNLILTPPLPSIPMPTARMFNRLLRGLEDERFFHRVAYALIGDSLGRIIGVAIGLASFVLLLYGAKKVMERRQRLETRTPGVALGLVAGLPSAPRLQQREQALFRQANLGDEACRLARAWLDAEFSVPPEQWPADFHVEGFFWTRWRLARHGALVLRLARTTLPIQVSRREFFALIEAIKQLSRAKQAGRLALQVESKIVT